MDGAFCDEAYTVEQCYRPDASGKGQVCVQCCRNGNCNRVMITEKRKDELTLTSNARSCSISLFIFILLIIIKVS